jgi:hypothetical protein
VEAPDAAGSAGASPDAAAAALIMWRAPARRRWSCIAWSVLALLAAIAIEVTGPQRPVAFGLRLPLIVAGCGGLWCAARWRRQVAVTATEVVVRTMLRTRRIPHGAGGAEVIARARDGRVLPGRLRVPAPSAVPMMTPCLMMSATMIVALGCAKILTVAPRMSGALIAVSAAVCVAALAPCLRLDRRAGPPRRPCPGSRPCPGPGEGISASR